MGRRFQAKYLDHGQKDIPPVSGGIKTILVAPEYLKPQLCQECGGEDYLKLVQVYALPQTMTQDGGVVKAGNLSFVDVMMCRQCGWVRANDNIPQFIKDHGSLRFCGGCGGNLYEESYSIAEVSRIIAGGGKDKIVLRKVLYCKRCGKKLEAYQPEAADANEADQQPTK